MVASVSQDLGQSQGVRDQRHNIKTQALAQRELGWSAIFENLDTNKDGVIDLIIEGEDGLWTRWYENGQKKEESSFKDGKLMSAVRWKPNGEKCPVTNVEDGNGVVVYYRKDGTKWFHNTFKDGEPSGDIVHY